MNDLRVSCGLNQDEIRVLEGLLTGESCKIIGKRLGKSTRAIDDYTRRLKIKTSTPNRVRLIIWWYENRSAYFGDKQQ